MLRGTHTGPAVLPDGTPVPPSGQAVRLPECLVFTVRGDKVVRMAAYVEMLDSLAGVTEREVFA